ncbi:MAG: hypothetical protein II087_00290, partial [Muribaculaceae bacterium]|nr:hypothetical protein [Muribaculaceae bacterium]
LAVQKHNMIVIIEMSFFISFDDNFHKVSGFFFDNLPHLRYLVKFVMFLDVEFGTFRPQDY